MPMMMCTSGPTPIIFFYLLSALQPKATTALSLILFTPEKLCNFSKMNLTNHDH